MEYTAMEDAVFVIIHGNDWSVPGNDINAYVAGIVYGAPKITAVDTEADPTQPGHFVALLEYDGEGAGPTFDRMASFGYGAQLMGKRDVALREFGCWISHYAKTLDTKTLND